MRRHEREITAKNALEVIMRKASICYLGLSDNNIPYCVPMNFGYANNALYLHSALLGKKIDIIKTNKRVCFTIVNDYKVIIGSNACASTTHYQSVIGFGDAVLLEDRKEKIEGLNILMQQQDHNTNTKQIDYGAAIDRILIIKVNIDTLTGKENL
ncbi:MAG: pyridoxamine 5'-phosphate oxidase family protein [Gammaproteobacteria bacterium]|nr:pyridoxamine 5'-phosphate oxidase family protein [Gammaproteobacteria bacterium]